MGPTYLIDTNVVIDGLDDKTSHNLLQKVNMVVPVVSAATYIEALGWHKITPAQLQLIQNFMDNAIVLQIDEPVVETAVLIKQQKKIGLGDAIIAATAIVHGLVLVTRNVSDFNSIDNLTVYNPWEQSGNNNNL
jgi:predicted nucleic acid-binding protein